MLMLFRRMGAALRKRQFGQMFYEFLLIFLAVMAGFAAENWRESLEDQKRLKEYLLGLRNDIQADLKRIEQVQEADRARLEDIKYIVQHLSPAASLNQRVEVTSRARFLARRVEWLSLQNQTYNQMKSAGDLRLLQGRSLADSLGSYYLHESLLERRFAFFHDQVLEIQGNMAPFFNFPAFFLLIKGGRSAEVAEVLAREPETQYSPAELKSFLMQLQYIFGTVVGHVAHLEVCRHQGQRLETLLTAEIEKLE